MDRRIFKDDALEQEFRERGYVVVNGLLDAESRRKLLDLFERTRTDQANGFHASVYSNDLEYRKAVCPTVQTTMENALRPILVDHRVCMGNLMVKEPDPASEMPLHQDWAFVDEPDFLSVHVWTPLIDVNSENGCLAVVPGSHHLSDTVRAFADDCPFRETFPLIRERYLKELPMQAGDAVVYDGRLIHASKTNATSQRRIAAQCIAVPREAVVSHAWRVSPTQVQLFEAPDEFFLRYVLHQPPQDAVALRLVDYEVKQLSPEQISVLDAYLEAEVR